MFAASFRPDGKQVLTASADRTAALFDVGTGRRVRSFDGVTDRVMSVAFAADGKRAADRGRRAGRGPVGRTPRRPAEVLRGHGGAVWSAALSPDGKRILTGSERQDGGAVGRRQPASLRALPRPRQDRRRASAFSPDGKRVLTGSLDKTAALWDAEHRRAARAFAGHTDSVMAVAFSPDGKRVADRLRRQDGAGCGTPTPASRLGAARAQRTE